MREVDNLVELIRATVTVAEREIGTFVGRLELVNDDGFSPKCLSMIRLKNDAMTLRALADRIEAQRSRLVLETHLVAAE